MPAARAVAIGGIGPCDRPVCFADCVGQCFEIIRARRRGLGLALDEDDRPAAGNDEPIGVRGAQVVGVGLGIGRQWPEDGGGLGVCVRQRRDGRRRAGRPRAAPGLHFWNASCPGWPGPSPSAMCGIVSGDPGRRTLVTWPTRPAVQSAVRATEPTRPPPQRGTRLLPDDRRGRVRPAAGDGTGVAGGYGDGWCHRSFRCT